MQPVYGQLFTDHAGQNEQTECPGTHAWRLRSAIGYWSVSPQGAAA